MRTSLFFGTLLIASQVLAGGSQVGNAGDDKTSCWTIQSINSFTPLSNDQKFETIHSCKRHISKLLATVNSYESYVQERKNQMLSIASDFDKDGNKPAADLYRNIVKNEINWRASILASTVSDPTGFFFEMPMDPTSPADITDNVQSIHAQTLNNLLEQLNQLESNPLNFDVLDKFYRSFGAGYQPLTEKFHRAVTADQASNSLFTNVMLYKLVHVDSSCFPEKPDDRHIDKRDEFISNMYSGSHEAETKKALHVNLVTEKDFVGKLAKNNTTIVCRFEKFKHSQNYRQLNEFNSELIETSKYARFKPSLQISADLKTVTLKQSALVSDDLCDLDKSFTKKSKFKCVEPDVYYDFGGLLELSRKALAQLKEIHRNH